MFSVCLYSHSQHKIAIMIVGETNSVSMSGYDNLIDKYNSCVVLVK